MLNRMTFRKNCFFIFLLPLLLIAPASAENPGGDQAKQNTGKHEGLWNQSTLLQWVSGIGDQQSPFDHLDSVKSFELLQQSIEEAKQLVLHDASSEREAVEGLRMILKHLASSTRDWVTPDYRNPLSVSHDSRYRDIGAYNPDAEYDQALIDGRYDYKLSGDVGTVPYLSVTVSGPVGGKFSQVIAYLNDKAIRNYVDKNNRFTLWLSKKKPQQPGAWVPLPDEANSVVIRQYVSDRSTEKLAAFSIEAVGDVLPDPSDTSDLEIAARIKRTSDYLLISSTWHRTLLPEMKNTPNQFVASTGNAIGGSAANTENYYQMAYYKIDNDEALLVELRPPDTVFWNLTSASFWHESQRFLSDPVSLTSGEVQRDEDGLVRFIVSATNPGHPNWINTFGRDRGFLILRTVDVSDNPLPTVRRIATTDLPGKFD